MKEREPSTAPSGNTAAPSGANRETRRRIVRQFLTGDERRVLRRLRSKARAKERASLDAEALEIANGRRAQQMLAMRTGA